MWGARLGPWARSMVAEVVLMVALEAGSTFGQARLVLRHGLSVRLRMVVHSVVYACCFCFGPLL